jgi:hypothetical protein
MDPRLLVNRERAAAAARLCDALRADGFELQAAMWAKTEYDSQPYLYLVTPQIDRDGPIGAYRKLSATFGAFQPEPADPLDQLDFHEIKLLAPRERLADGLLQYLKRHPTDRPTLDGGYPLIPVEAAYIYPNSLFAQPASA